MCQICFDVNFWLHLYVLGFWFTVGLPLGAHMLRLIFTYEFVPFTIPLRDTHFRSSTLGSGLKYSCNFMLNIWAIETHLNETQAEMTSQPKLSEHSITYVLSVGSECPLIYLVFCVIFVLYTSPLIVWLSVC